MTPSSSLHATSGLKSDITGTSFLQSVDSVPPALDCLMQFPLSIAKLLLVGSIIGAAAKNFDLIPSDWSLAWENVTISDHLDFSQCVLACEVTKRCVGGRLEAASEKCHLTLRSDDRWLAMYEKKSAGADRVFGVTCNPKTGFYNQSGHRIGGYNVEIHKRSTEECSALCARRFWCRSFDKEKIGNKHCFLANVGNDSSTLRSSTGHDLIIRIC